MTLTFGTNPYAPASDVTLNPGKPSTDNWFTRGYNFLTDSVTDAFDGNDATNAGMTRGDIYVTKDAAGKETAVVKVKDRRTGKETFEPAQSGDFTRTGRPQDNPRTIPAAQTTREAGGQRQQTMQTILDTRNYNRDERKYNNSQTIRQGDDVNYTNQRGQDVTHEGNIMNYNLGNDTTSINAFNALSGAAFNQQTADRLRALTDAQIANSGFANAQKAVAIVRGQDNEKWGALANFGEKLGFLFS